MKAKLSAPWAQGAASSRREPTVSEIASGFPCGQADQFLFNELIYRLTMQEAELANVVTGAGGAASETDLRQVLKALRSQRANYAAAAGGSANAITLTYNPAFAALADLTRVPLRFSVAATNTGPATLSVDGLAVKALIHHDGSAFVGGELVPGAIIEAMYDGTAFRLQSLFGAGRGYRIRLGADLTLYVNASTGNDATGLGTSAAPWATMQKAWDYLVQNYDLNGYNVTVNCSGTFTAPFVASGAIVGQVSATSVVFTGNTTTPSSVLINVSNASAVTAGNGGRVTVHGFKIQASGTGVSQGYGIAASGGGAVLYGNIDFGACGRCHIYAVSGQVIGMTPAQPSVISGVAPIHALSDVSGFIDFGATSYTFSGAINFSTAFAFASTGSTIVAYNGVTFGTGAASVTGTRYVAEMGGAIDTLFGGVSFFPGSVGGSTGAGTATGFYR